MTFVSVDLQALRVSISQTLMDLLLGESWGIHTLYRSFFKLLTLEELRVRLKS